MIDWTEYDSPNHLDIIFFGIFWTFMAIEYYLWRKTKL
tara:strand:- start:4919 stop:5032 length:114 start_codon:yes stop_codon:yes gene_type:complete